MAVTLDTVRRRHSGIAIQAKRKTEIIVAPILFGNKESSGADKSNVGKSSWHVVNQWLVKQQALELEVRSLQRVGQ